jgi:hypothetical protein
MRTVSRAALQAQPIRHFLVLDPRKPDNAVMQRIITLAERKASETARRRAAVDTLVPYLPCSTPAGRPAGDPYR